MVYKCFRASSVQPFSGPNPARLVTVYIIVSNLGLPQLGAPGSCIYSLQEQGSPVIPPVNVKVKLTVSLHVLMSSPFKFS
jgi:hypothetical protein